MRCLIKAIGIISIIISNIFRIIALQSDKYIIGLKERLVHFGDCNIRVSRSLEDKFTVWEPISVPVEIRGSRQIDIVLVNWSHAPKTSRMVYTVKSSYARVNVQIQKS